MTPPPHLRLVDALPGSIPSDDACMVAAAAGDARAFEALVARHEVALRRFCRTLVGDESSARDAAQETFLKLWASRERYRPEGKLKAFLFTLARNHCRSQIRRRAVLAWVGLSSDASGSAPLDDQPSAPDQLAALQSQRLVTVALDRLPEKLRTPLVLRFVDGLPYEDIARVIGRTPSAARSRVHYGLIELKKRLPAEVLP